MEEKLLVLPTDLAQIADKVSLEKRGEVQSVLNHVFNGVAKMKEQLNEVVVTDMEDKVSMKLAATIRLGVRQVRLASEKTFDAKRAEIQNQMLGFKTEDSLWLKAKQTMQILTREIEENARWKEETRERFDAEQREAKVQQRIFKMGKVAPEIERAEFENMSDDVFDVFFTGFEQKLIASIEAERLAEVARIAKAKEEEEERGRIREENEKLKAEAEERERELAKERFKAEEERKALEEVTRKEREVAENLLQASIEKARLAAEKAAAEKAALEFEIRERAEKAEREKKAAENILLDAQKAKEAAAEKAEKAPDKVKLNDLAAMLENISMPEFKSEEAQKILDNVKILLSKVSIFIRDKSESL